MPTSSNVTNALVQTSQIANASYEWNQKGCDIPYPDVLTCSTPAMTVETYFSGLTQLVYAITG